MKNVILLTIDALRQDVFGCYGNKLGVTPFIDSLQEHCIRFTNAQSCGPYTQASFPAILTSSYYHEYGKTEQLSTRRTLISEVLQKAGFDTAAFHSNAYLCGFFGWSRGWNTFYDSMEVEVDDKEPYIKASELNGRVSRWIEFRKTSGKNQPFFLWLHYMDVHEPYVPERKYVEAVDPSISLNDDEMFALFKETLLKRDILDQDKVQLLKKLYLAHVKEVDEATKEFFGILEQAGVLQDTVILITSDHGDEFGEHGGLSHDGRMFRELIDVPLFIYDPDLTGETVRNELVSLLDVSPTIVHLCGLEPIKEFQGQSLLPLDTLHSRTVFGEAYFKKGSHEPKENLREIHYCREGNLKIIYSEQDDSWQMYDLEKDPQERNDIINGDLTPEELKNKIRPRIRRYTAERVE